jgi:hypothetical protein
MLAAASQIAAAEPTFAVIYTGDTRGYLEDCG